jgi:hypothetical protein
MKVMLGSEMNKKNEDVEVELTWYAPKLGRQC